MNGKKNYDLNIYDKKVIIDVVSANLYNLRDGEDFNHTDKSKKIYRNITDINILQRHFPPVSESIPVYSGEIFLIPHSIIF